MRVINLDEIGIKIITADRKQMYLSVSEVKDFLDRKYSLEDNVLKIRQKCLTLTESDKEEFDSIYSYIKGLYNKG